MQPVRRAWEWTKERAAWGGRGRTTRRWLNGLLAVVVGVWLLVTLSDTYIDWLWFEQLGHASVLGTRWLTGGLLAVLVGGLSTAALVGNLVLAGRLSAPARAPAAVRLDAELRAFLEQVSAGLGDGEPRAARSSTGRSPEWRPEAPRPEAGDRLRGGLLVVGWVFAIVLGIRATEWTEAVLRWRNATPFGMTESLFGRDVSAYVFTLPVIRPLVGWLLVLAVSAGLLVGALYLTQALRARAAGAHRRGVLASLAHAQRVHIAALGAAVLVASGLSHLVARADLVLSTRGRAVGVGFPGFADLQVQAPADVLMALVALVAAGLLVLAAWRGGSHRLAWWPVAGYLGIVLIGYVLPLVVQVLVVLPNDVDLEQSYLNETIRLTREAYGLNSLHEQGPPAASASSDVGDVPLWTRLAMDNNLNQLQGFRPYYAFSSAQPDRYVVDGQPRLVMVAARELNPEGLPSRSWSSTHLQFTHGYGATIALADEGTPEGAPVWVDQDVPVRGPISIDRPEIYFGLRTSSYAVVKSSQPELDFPRPDQDATTRYAGEGVPLGGGLARLAFAVALRDPSLLFSQAVNGQSEVLLHRQVLERVTRLAPFLRPDPEPQLVVADGRLVWVVDAYTATADFPAVQRRPFGLIGPRPGAGVLGGAPENYVRDSVKATVDAYDGTVRLFVADPDDPLLRAESAAYPGLFEPLDQMPPAIRAHLRYPRLLLSAQADVLARFHVQDPTSFARGEDAWRLPEEPFAARLDSGPAYGLSGAGGDLVLTQPFSPFDPSGAQGSLLALLVARGDGAPSGSALVLQRYSRDPAVPGPLDVDRRINQQPEIASQMADWQRGGASVLRGKALPIPVGPQPVYAEAIFLQRGPQSTLPQLQGVVVVQDTRVVMEPTLSAALERLRSGQ